MTRIRVTGIVCALIVALVAVSSAKSQNTSRNPVIDEHSNAQTAEIAEAIIAREEAASGRRFDPAYRTKVKADLASRSPEELAAVQERGFGLLPGSKVSNVLGSAAVDLASPTPSTLGLSTSADLVYNPVVPCRIIDTRSGAGRLTAGSQRSFFVSGTAGFATQGGNSGGCGIPSGPATAVVINFVAVSAAGMGDLRITPFGTAIPLASIINYAAVPGLNIANGPVVKICDPASTTCTFDITIETEFNDTDLVADVQGYFAAPRGGVFLTQLLGNTSTSPGLVTGYLNMISNYVPPVNARAFTFNRCSWGTTAAGQTLSFRSAIRTPTGTGTVTVGNAFYLFPSSAGTETLFNENNDFFDLTAGQSYDFGMNLHVAPFNTAAGVGTCSTMVQVFSR